MTYSSDEDDRWSGRGLIGGGQKVIRIWREYENAPDRLLAEARRAYLNLTHDENLKALYMSDNARGMPKILAKSGNYVPRAALIEELDIKNDRRFSYVLAYMTSYSSFYISDIIESSADELRLPDHLRKVVLSTAGRNY